MLCRQIKIKGQGQTSAKISRCHLFAYSVFFTRKSCLITINFLGKLIERHLLSRSDIFRPSFMRLLEYLKRVLCMFRVYVLRMFFLTFDFDFTIIAQYDFLKTIQNRKQRYLACG